jgi:hypothetical protein
VTADRDLDEPSGGRVASREHDGTLESASEKSFIVLPASDHSALTIT